jgi:uncharacterized membrane protein YphA (DoxX/SURF4 family)
VNLLRNVWLHRVLGLVVGAVFIYASHDKILMPAAFARIVYHYQLIGPNAYLPALLPNLLAVILPWVELLAGMALIVGVWRREASVVAATLLVVFVLAVGQALVRGIDIENCGCFALDSAGRAAGLKLILEDLALLLGALLLVCLPPIRDAARGGEASPAAERA